MWNSGIDHTCNIVFERGRKKEEERGGREKGSRDRDGWKEERWKVGRRMGENRGEKGGWVKGDGKREGEK